MRTSITTFCFNSRVFNHNIFCLSWKKETWHSKTLHQCSRLNSAIKNNWWLKINVDYCYLSSSALWRFIYLCYSLESHCKNRLHSSVLGNYEETCFGKQAQEGTDVSPLLSDNFCLTLVYLHQTLFSIPLCAIICGISE